MRSFDDLFKTEADCQQYLFDLRWPDGFRCPRCGGAKAWPLERGLYRCTRCDYQVSVTAGTIFHGSRQPLWTWFKAMWYVTNQKSGVSALGLQKALDLGSYHTAWAWMHKLRTAMVRPGRDRLSGRIEIGVTYVGGRRPGKRGRGAGGKVLVVIIAQDQGNRIGRIRLRRVRDASALSLEQVIQEEVEPGSVVLTDGWTGYGGLLALGYRHFPITKGGRPGEVALPLVKRVANLIEQRLAATHQAAVRPLYIDYYLDEFTFRFNRRTWHSREWLFQALIQQAAAAAPLPVAQMRERKRAAGPPEKGAGPPKPPLRRKHEKAGV